ncbi:MAG: hypothetical protein ACREHD_28395, partial [Pirellulales bacterium]
DKETFHFAFLRTNTPFAMPPDYFPLPFTMCQHDFAGRRVFQHRVCDKWRLDGGNRWVDDFWFEDLCRYFVEELADCWSGRPFWSPPHREHQQLVVGEFAQRPYWYERVGGERRVLELLDDGAIGEGADVNERWWSVNTVQGQNVLTILGDNSTTCHLTRKNGAWSGHWRPEDVERVRLTPIEQQDE